MILSFSRYWMRYWINLFPGSFFRVARNLFWRSVGFHVHRDANLMSTVKLICWDIEIGSGTYVGEEVMITGGKISIGLNCDIAPRCILHAGSHEIGVNDRRAGKTFGSFIIIGNGCWIGTSATILAGVKLGKGTMVAAGAVVMSGQYPDNVLLAGTPARIKKYLPPLQDGTGK